MRTPRRSLNGSAANTSPHTGMSALPWARMVSRPSIARITRPSGNSPPASRARRVRSGGALASAGRDHTAALPVHAMACGAVPDEERAVGVLALAGSPRARRDDEGRDRDGDQDSIDRVMRSEDPFQHAEVMFPGVCFDLALRTGERDLDLRDRSGQPVDTLFDVDPTDASGSRRLCTPVQHDSSIAAHTGDSASHLVTFRHQPATPCAHRLEFDAARLAERLQGIGHPRPNERAFLRPKDWARNIAP